MANLKEILDQIEVQELPKEVISYALDDLCEVVKDQINATHGLLQVAKNLQENNILVPNNLIEAYNHLMIAGKHLACIPDMNYQDLQADLYILEAKLEFLVNLISESQLEEYQKFCESHGF